MVFNTFTVGAAVTPELVACAATHYATRQKRHEKPTAHLSYHEGLRVVRQFIIHASHHTVEDIQAFTGKWVPAPQWVKLEAVTISAELLRDSARIIQRQLGPEGLEAVGGKQWWQWRERDAPMKAEWIETKTDYHARKRSGSRGNRIMLYVHGGAYYFGSVDEHRYQIQRHARKLKARCLAPRYRLSPQYPFPCGLYDCLATYLFLLKSHDPTEILLAGDSAGGGMVLAMLIIIRDQKLPLPAGAILLSPWVDLTHSFPSLAGEGDFDYIPAHGFHHRPSRSWPVPDEIYAKRDEAVGADMPTETRTPYRPKLTLNIDGQPVTIKDQVQMYAANNLLRHPLVSPILAPSLGGLPPLLIQAGGGELLLDEQVYLAHKAANPSKYLPSEALLAITDPDGTAQKRHRPTNVQLQVWDDLCHVTHTLSWTRPAKYMYRAAAQFGAWALARAQQRGIDILVDDDISEISEESSAIADVQPPKNGRLPGTESTENCVKTDSSTQQQIGKSQSGRDTARTSVGKAGDPLPSFIENMIRQRVDRHGACYHLDDPSDMPCLNLPREAIGSFKEVPARRWLAARAKWETTYASATKKIAATKADQEKLGYVSPGPGERPPLAALAGRRRLDKNGKEVFEGRKRERGWGLSLWAFLGGKHDEKTLEHEKAATTEVEVEADAGSHGETTNVTRTSIGESAGTNGHGQSQTQDSLKPRQGSVSSAHYVNVVDAGQVQEGAPGN